MTLMHDEAHPTRTPARDASRAHPNFRPDRAAVLALQRAAGNRVAGRWLAVQRYREDVSVRGMGSSSDSSRVTFGPLSGSVWCVGPAGPIHFTPGMHVGFDGPGGRVPTLTLPEGVTGGRVRLAGMVSAEVVNMLFDDHPYMLWDGSVPFMVSGETITFGAQLADSESHGSGATLSIAVGSGQTTGGGYVTFTATVVAAGSESLGGGVGVGPVSGSAPVSGSSTYAGGASRSFTVNLRISPPRPLPGPDVDFKVGKATLADGQEAAVTRWFLGLPQEAQDAIRNGRRAVTISGYASTTARRRRNRELSEQRARVVERILRGFAGSGATIHVFYFGEDNATTPDETEDATWRRATIEAQAPMGTRPALPGPPP